MSETVMLSRHLTEDEVWAARASSSFHRQVENGWVEPVLSPELINSWHIHFGGYILQGLGLRVAEYNVAGGDALEGVPDYRIEPVDEYPRRGDRALML